MVHTLQLTFVTHSYLLLPPCPPYLIHLYLEFSVQCALSSISISFTLWVQKPVFLIIFFNILSHCMFYPVPVSFPQLLIQWNLLSYLYKSSLVILPFKELWVVIKIHLYDQLYLNHLYMVWVVYSFLLLSKEMKSMEEKGTTYRHHHHHMPCQRT